MPSNIEAMERREDPLRAGWRLQRASKIIQNLLDYLTEKTCGTEDIVFWSNPAQDTLYYVFSTVSKEFMQEVILPWVWEWSRKNERLTCGRPFVSYLHDNKIRLNIPLTSYEQDIVMSWKTGSKRRF